MMMDLWEFGQVAHRYTAFCFIPLSVADPFLLRVESLLFHP